MSGLPGALAQALRRARALWLRGGRVECPVCGGRFRGFLPGGPDRRPGAQCPGCGALERHRLLWIYLRERTSLFRDPLRLLHLAPERHLQRCLRSLPRLRVVSGDLDSPLAEARLDLARLPFREGAFDALLCSHVLEHVADARGALRELRRVLRPGGWAILQSPVDAARAVTFEDPTVATPRERMRWFGQADHVRVFGRDYPEWLRAAGFEVTVDGYVRELDAERAARWGLDREEDVYFCRRPSSG
jgi:SAM-dependent methyltransferase